MRQRAFATKYWEQIQTIWMPCICAALSAISAEITATAVAFLSKASDQDPWAGAVLNNLGLAHLTLNDLQSAAGCFRRAIAIDEDDIDARTNLARVLVAQGHADEAVANLQRVLSARPESAETFFELGKAYQAQGRASAALAAYQGRYCCGPIWRNPT